MLMARYIDIWIDIVMVSVRDVLFLDGNRTNEAMAEDNSLSIDLFINCDSFQNSRLRPDKDYFVSEAKTLQYFF